MIVYLAHPIHSANPTSDHFTQKLKEGLVGIGVEVIDPADWEFNETESAKIVAANKDGMRNADAIIAVALTPSWGTAMEMHWARTVNHKPVFALVPEGVCSSWIKEHTEACFDNVSEMIGYFRAWAK